jgi:exopolyphosphatase/guanosine-5'-triphosphate,3'-diphosphate pyrophosphatase
VNKFSVIDCGTNTFNLIIVNTLPELKTIYQEKIPVKIGFNLNSTRLISDDAIGRAIDAMKIFKQKSIEFDVEKIIAVGTSAFRDSLNAHLLLKKVYEHTGINIRVINGEKEAELIARGIFFGWNNKSEKSLIVDIGGGSNECIIANEQEKILWKKSYPLGMARILGAYPHGDPIKSDEIKFYEKFFYNEMNDMWKAIDAFRPTVILGASGAFDTIHDMLEPQNISNHIKKNYPVNLNDFSELYQRVVFSTLREREEMIGLVAMRRDMIVLSLIYIDTILKNSKLEKLICCKGSLKEGVIREVMEGKWQ